jgi:epoxyqueuosine reductase
MSLATRLKAKATELGCDLVGITSAAPPATHEHYLSWLAAGYAGRMDYLHRQAESREKLDHVLPGVRSVVVVAVSYHDAREGVRPLTGLGSPGTGLGLPAVGTGRIASYAQRPDYHQVLWSLLDQLGVWLEAEVPGCRWRSVVDSAPVLERDLARRAGLGWFGKNTMLLHPRLGSTFFLGALLTTAELPTDPPFATDHCGTCTACLDACPTAAFVSPGILDARRCISYLTIELKDPIPRELRSSMGDWVFGCDVCQEVCPWNQKVEAARLPALAPRADLQHADLGEWLRLAPEEFRQRFRATPLTRPKRRGLLRNVCIALGNRGDPAAVPLLVHALADDEPLIRGAAAWALGQLATAAALEALRSRWEVETEPTVRAELSAALRLNSPTDTSPAP